MFFLPCTSIIMSNSLNSFGEMSNVPSMRIQSQSPKNVSFSSVVKTTMCDVVLFTYRNGPFLFFITAGNIWTKIHGPQLTYLQIYRGTQLTYMGEKSGTQCTYCSFETFFFGTQLTCGLLFIHYSLIQKRRQSGAGNRPKFLAN